MIRILGIDPGTINLGYGVVEVDEEMKALDFGVIHVAPSVRIEKRLQYIYEKLNDVILRSNPDEVAIEQLFIGKNAKSAFAIGAAQTVAVLAAVNKGLLVYYYSPTMIKQHVTSYGHSDKKQVQEMVKIHLGLLEPPEPNDAADALATAICHINCSRFNRWVTERA